MASRKLDAYLYYLLGENLPYDGHYENLKEVENGALRYLMLHASVKHWKRYLSLSDIGIPSVKSSGCYGWYCTESQFSASTA